MPVVGRGATPNVYRSGFLNRLAAALGGTAAPVSFTDGLPMVMTGDVVVPNVSLKGIARPPFDDRQAKLLTGLYARTRSSRSSRKGSSCGRRWPKKHKWKAAA
jgi:hypothetical protein